MDLLGLYDLIKYLEFGTKLHIGVVFLSNGRNSKCAIPHGHTIHSKPICEMLKKDPREYEKCLRCRNERLKRAIGEKAPFGELCVQGVYEYTHPIFHQDRALAVIFVGNILTDEGRSALLSRFPAEIIPFETMQSDFAYDRCEQIALLVEGYLRTLIEKYPEERCDVNPIVENVRSYVRANIEYDISLSDVASLYFYNEVYLGRLFKKETGKSFKEYLNEERIKIAKKHLSDGKSVIESANKSGYNNVTYFNRVFKAETGLTPVEYKKKAK